jgi:hypothetical protein
MTNWNTETPCTCGHTGFDHHPGSYKNADQRAVHYGCNACACLHYNNSKEQPVSFKDDVKKAIDEYLPQILQSVQIQVADTLEEFTKRQGGGVITRKPVVTAPVVTVSPDTVDPITLAIAEAVLHHKWVCVVYDSEDVLPSIPDLEALAYSDKIKRISHVVGQQVIDIYNGTRVFIRSKTGSGQRGINVDLVIRVPSRGTTIWQEMNPGTSTATEK